MKRTLTIVLSLLFILPCLLIPAMAAEVYVFSDEWDEELLSYLFYDNIPSGTYVLEFTFNEMNFRSEAFVLTWERNPDSGEDVFFMEFTAYNDESSLDCRLSMCAPDPRVEAPGLLELHLWDEDMYDYWSSQVSFLTLTSLGASEPSPDPDPDSPSNPSPLSPVQESMSSVLEWVGTVATSLLSGELSPLLLLLAIPIAISLIFLAIKAIKMVFNL